MPVANHPSSIPVVDIFAGPGGLGEGFSAYRRSGSPFFKLTLSIEKELWAHTTLTLRAFRRQFERSPKEYLAFLEGRASMDGLFAAYTEQADAARAEALRMELSASTSREVSRLVGRRIPKDGPWVLIGGPPCQAYSLIGRARSRSISSYVPEADHRQKLYVEYLQLLSDHAPPFFVMENVKGLLSARLDGRGLFDLIRSDLHDPKSALQREGRTGRQRPRYRLHSFVYSGDLFEPIDPAAFVIRSEEYGIPQSRHRVIILGIAEELKDVEPSTLRRGPRNTVANAIADLPRLRSGMSGAASWDDWRDFLEGAPGRHWFALTPSEVQKAIREAIGTLKESEQGRGGECLAGGSGRILNHTSRSHIPTDLDRYLFVSAFGAVRGKSPTLADFPKSLLPEHRSAGGGSSSFADRFRVQLADRPSSTVTSHIAKDGHYYIHFDTSQCRSLTVREAARLQSFPDDYFFCGPRTAQYQQVGNAVPPKLAKQLAAAVADLISRD